jgi:hypothetical protein
MHMECQSSCPLECSKLSLVLPSKLVLQSQETLVAHRTCECNLCPWAQARAPLLLVQHQLRPLHQPQAMQHLLLGDKKCRHLQHSATTSVVRRRHQLEWRSLLAGTHE